MRTLPSLGWDLTRVGAVLYVAGLLASIFYYAQFNIFSFEILRVQCVMTGALMSIFYGVVPFVAISLAQFLGPRKFQIIIAILLVTIFNSAILFFVNAGWVGSLVGSLVGSTIQMSLFVRRFSAGVLTLSYSPDSARLLILLPFFAFHYALLVHPSIPGYFGGGAPLAVSVYADPQEIPSDRFVRSKNRNRANVYRDSYAMSLLYETSQDYYFVEQRRSAKAIEGYAVVRISKQKIVRIDYFTPAWVSMRGVK